MSKKPIIGGIILAVIIGVVFVGAEINPDNPENKEVWSIRMAGPGFDNISDHMYGPITLEREVPYEFHFVPMGDSPERLGIWVVSNQIGVGTIFSANYLLEGTLVDTGISEYYTWDYTGPWCGQKLCQIEYLQCREKTCEYDIIVKRYGNLKGSVTISLSR